MSTYQSQQTLLPELPGIDRADGLARAMDDEALYASILLEFLGRYRTAPQELRDAREADDFQRLSFLVHKLKGITGTIGARAAFAAAERVESSWSDVKQPPLDLSALVLFNQQLEQLLAGLGAAEENLGRLEAGQLLPETADLSAVPYQLSKLANLLDEADVEAGSLFKSLRPSLAPMFEAQVLESLAHEIDDLHFESASQILDEIIAINNKKGEQQNE